MAVSEEVGQLEQNLMQNSCSTISPAPPADQVPTSPQQQEQQPQEQQQDCPQLQEFELPHLEFELEELNHPQEPQLQEEPQELQEPQQQRELEQPPEPELPQDKQQPQDIQQQEEPQQEQQSQQQQPQVLKPQQQYQIDGQEEELPSVSHTEDQIDKQEEELPSVSHTEDQIDLALREPSPPLPFLLSQESLPSPSQERPQSESDADAHEYVVEEILDKRLDANGEVKLLVKWENYPSSHNTWEPLDNLRDCDEVTQRYEIKRAQRLAKLYGGLNLYGEGNSKMSGDTADKKDKRHQEYKVSEVIGLTEVKDQRYFLVNLQDDGGSAYIRSSLANKLFPCKVIDFYMKHITWKKPT